jgi:putative addiction module component (TIGR02574 family)
MSLQIKEIVNKALNLSPEERAELIHELILSLDDIIDNEVDRAWEAEIEKRVKEIKSGKAKGRPADDILAEIRAKYS